MAFASSHPSHPMTGGFSSNNHNLTVPATIGALKRLHSSTMSDGWSSG
jgi:hypothetical protein